MGSIPFMIAIHTAVAARAFAITYQAMANRYLTVLLSAASAICVIAAFASTLPQ